MGQSCSSVRMLREKPADDIRRYYKIGVVLGSGSFGQVRECTHRQSGQTYAVKVMERKSREKSSGRPTNEFMIKSEVDMLKQLSHPYIISFCDFFEDKHFFYAVLEHCAGGELFYHIVKRRTFTEEDAATLCRQMLLSLEYLHTRSIVHRDVKAENFLFKEKSASSPLKLIDFGMSVKLPTGGYLTDLCGSPHYIAPELIRKNYNFMADMWAFGVMIYLMLFGRYPFEGAKSGDIAKEILTKQLDWDSKECSHLTDEAKDFMQQLLERSQSKRLTATNALRHPWICEQSLKKKQSMAVIPKEKLELARRLSMDAEHVAPDAETNARRSSKLQEVENDFKRGISTGKRVSTEEARSLTKLKSLLKLKNLVSANEKDSNNKDGLSECASNDYEKQNEQDDKKKKHKKKKKEKGQIEGENKNEEERGQENGDGGNRRENEDGEGRTEKEDGERIKEKENGEEKRENEHGDKRKEKEDREKRTEKEEEPKKEKGKKKKEKHDKREDGGEENTRKKKEKEKEENRQEKNNNHAVLEAEF